MVRLVVAAVVAALALAGLAPAAVAQGAQNAQDTSPPGFADVDGGVHKPAIDALDALGVFEDTGCGPQRFCPGEEMKRWTVAVWLVRILNEAEPPAVDESSFTDVDSGRWYLPHIERLADLGVSKGCATDPRRYCPDRPVTRSEMATLLARALGLVEVPEPAEPGAGGDTDPGGTATPDPPAVGPSACRPHGTSSTTAGFPLPSWAAPPAGTIRVGVLFLDFPDARATYSTEVEAAHGLPYAEEYLEASSYGRLDVEFVPLHGWLRAPRSVDDYLVDTAIGETRVSPGTKAIRLADPRFDFTGLNIVMTVLPSSLFGAGEHTTASAQTAEGVIGSMARINTAPHPDLGEPDDWGMTAAHEIAHGLGLLDLYPYDARRHRLPPEPTERKWVRSQFDLMELRVAFAARPNDARLRFTGSRPDGADVTGYTYTLGAGEMLAWSRWQLGWLDESQVHCIRDPEATVTLGPVADPGEAAAMAAVPLSDTEVLVIESRRKIGYDDDQERLHPDSALIKVPVLATEGVPVYTVDASVESGELPMRVAGDPGNGRVDDYPILTRGDRVVVESYTITVEADDGDTHTVAISRGRR